MSDTPQLPEGFEPVPATAPSTHAKPKSRFGVVEQVYFQSPDFDASAVSRAFGRAVTSDEQPYGPRRVAVGAEWQLLDAGWLSEVGCSQLHIVHEAPEWQTIPMPEEKAKALAKVVRVSLCYATEKSSWLLLPGDSMRGCPESIKDVWLRCEGGVQPAKVTVTIYPK